MRAARKYLVVCSLFALLLAAPAAAFAQDSVPEDRWQIGGDIYLWMASMGASPQDGGGSSIGFGKLVSNLKMGGMGGVNARRGPWVISGDVIYLNVGADTTDPIAGPGGGVAEDGGGLKLKGWVVSPTVGYTVVDQPGARFEVIAGARYLYLDTQININGSADGTIPPESISEGGGVWDGIIGLDGRIDLSDKFYMPLHLDVGTGGTKVSWQALGGFAYRLGTLDLVAVYRYLYFDLDDDALLGTVKMYGPLVGARFSF